MESFLIHSYFYLMILLLLGFFIAIIIAIFENKLIFTFISEATYYKLAAIVILGIFLRYIFAVFFPNVFNDEFLYIATAENMARTGNAFPYLFRSFPPVSWGVEKFIPPYPQLWPVILALIFKATNNFSYQMAGNVSMIFSILVPIPAFFVGYFLFETTKLKQEKPGEFCGLLTALFWAILPVMIKLSGCAAPEPASTFFISVYLALLFLFFRYPTSKTFFAMILSLCLAIHGRPENLLYILLLIPIIIRTKFKIDRISRYIALFILVVFALTSILIMAMGAGDATRAVVFKIEPRSVFTSKFQNFASNLLNNFLFLFGSRRVNPLLFTLMAIGGFFFLLQRGDDKTKGYFLLVWFALFYFIFTPYPFGDFSNSHSFDAFRFSLHIYFPMILSMSYCGLALKDLIQNSKWSQFATIVSATVLCIIVLSIYFNIPFIRIGHPEGFYFDSLREVSRKLPIREGSVIFISEKPELCLLTRYATGISTVLVETQDDIDKINQGKTRFFYFTTDTVSELILANFEIEIFLRHGDANKEYTVFELRKASQ